MGIIITCMSSTTIYLTVALYSNERRSRDRTFTQLVVGFIPHPSFSMIRGTQPIKAHTRPPSGWIGRTA